MRRLTLLRQLGELKGENPVAVGTREASLFTTASTVGPGSISNRHERHSFPDGSGGHHAYEKHEKPDEENRRGQACRPA